MLSICSRVPDWVLEDNVYTSWFVIDAGLIRQPKWGHLKDVHKAIKLCEEALVAADPTFSSPGPNLEVVAISFSTLAWF